MSRGLSQQSHQTSSGEDDSQRRRRFHRRIARRSRQVSRRRHQQDQRPNPLGEELERDLHTNRPAIFDYRTSGGAWLRSMDAGVNTALHRGHSSFPDDGAEVLSSRTLVDTNTGPDEFLDANTRGFYGLAAHDRGSSDPSVELQEPEHPVEHYHYRQRRREGQFPSHTWTSSGSDLDELLPRRLPNQHSMQQWEAQSPADEPWVISGPAAASQLQREAAEEQGPDDDAAANDPHWSVPRSMDIEMDDDYLLLLLSGNFSTLDDDNDDDDDDTW
ncbi:hypothetical protein MN608_09913 [Microdochium nivale]|nr:hypothetical protein MN608_09913 [Microdochium nivale]